MTDKEFEVFLKKCQEEVRAKQSNLNQECQINTYETNSFNQTKRRFELKKNTGE